MQSVTAPICRGVNKGHSVWIERFHGTGFFISDKGHFLTARHVIEDALDDAERNGGEVYFMPMMGNGSKNYALKLDACEYADLPHDVAICHVNFRSSTFFRLLTIDVEVWQDIAANGYPVSLSKKDSATYAVRQRFHKGYVQRVIPKGDQAIISPVPNAFEVSFPITKGLSGSPLFVHQNNEYETVIGICVGSMPSEIVDFQHSEILEDGKAISEKVVRIEEFGIAHDIRPLLNWKPNILNGQSLQQISDDTWANH